MVWNKEVAHERTPMSTRSRRVSLHMNLHVFLVFGRTRSPRYGRGAGGANPPDSGVALVGLAESRWAPAALSRPALAHWWCPLNRGHHAG